MEVPSFPLVRLHLLPISLLVLGINVAVVSGQCQGDQQSLLLGLKGDLSFGRSSKLATWDSRMDCCDWQGVSCDPGGLGHVIGLDLSNEWIFGWGIFDLQYLQRLNLAFNNFNTIIPARLANLTELLYLNLSDAGFFGQIPLQLSQLPKLATLALSASEDRSLKLENSNLTSLIQNLSSLRELHLNGIHVSGGLSYYINQLKNLSTVELVGCGLTGAIPSSMANLTQLVYLNLSNNELRDSIPSFNLSKSITYLDLSQNWLSGEISSILQGVSNLTYLDLSENQLSGEISSLSQGVRNLKKINLSHNQFSGSIPWSLLEIPTLEQIQLSANQFGDQIPEFSSTSTSFINYIDLSHNNLVGPIPSSVFNLSRLNCLFLSSNKLNGSVQLAWFRNLVNLSTLDLSYNHLTVDVTSNEPNLPSFPQLTTLKLASCNLTKFPDMGNQSKLSVLDLSMNNIREVLPRLVQFSSKSLEYLNLSYNFLKSLPEPSHFPNLQALDVHANQLHGEIPSLPASAFYIDYSSNNFTSVIPPGLGKNIYQFPDFFSLANNSLSGVIPESICDATLNGVLDLSNNRLGGKIPACLFEEIKDLAILNLRGNCLNGTIPDNFQANCSLLTLDLNSNELNGKVPKTLANCAYLHILDLGHNQINDIFPCALPNLNVLILRNNQFHGEIGCPTIQGSWEELQIVDLAHNQFNGTLPIRTLYMWKAMKEGGNEVGDQNFSLAFGVSSQYVIPTIYYDQITVTSKGLQRELGKILRIFTYIDFSCNQLEGKLPEAIGQLKALHILNLSHNFFNGPIPPSIGNLSQLESLDLSVNNFSGEIPPQLAKLSFLSVLNLSDNKFTGSIPSGTQIQSFSASSFEDNAGLCGPPLPLCLHPPRIQYNPLLSTPPKQSRLNWEFIFLVMGFGTGFGMGVAGVVTTLVLHKDVNGWCDVLVDKILIVLLPMARRKL